MTAPDAPDTPPPAPGQPEVRAAGGVLLRGTDGRRPEVLVVHRPRYDDWSLPKGKLDPGESWEQAAIREVHEETGVTARLGVELASTTYTDRHGRAKQVRWWTMPVLDDRRRPPDDEVDELRWVPVDEVADLLSHDDDRTLVTQALDATDHATVLLVRHGHAGVRDGWRGDDRLRHLDPVGRQQAEDLVPLLAPWQLTRVVSSPLVRCVETVGPLAEATGMVVEEDDRLAEGATPEQTRDLLRDCASGTVLCSHGDVIGDLVAQLADQGLVDRHTARFAKGSTWVLRLDGDRRPVAASYLAPPQPPPT